MDYKGFVQPYTHIQVGLNHKTMKLVKTFNKMLLLITDKASVFEAALLKNSFSKNILH